VTEQKQPRTLAITLNWRQPEVTLKCIRALLAMEQPELDILVIDNGSGDDSVDKLKQSGLPFELLSLEKNVGFAAGNNRGLRLALERGYDFSLLINNDAVAAPDMLQKLLAESSGDIGLLSPKIYFESDPQRIWFAGGRRDPRTLDVLDTGHGQFDGLQFSASRDVDYLVGTCLLVNMAAVRVIGFLDERYFFYFEDLDWSLRFVEAGYRLRLVADAHLYHQVAVSTGGEYDTALRRYYLARGGVVFWGSHIHLGNTPIIVGFRLLSAVKMIGRLAITGKWAVAGAYMRGLRDGWKDTKRPASGRPQE
jgi:GT2 family glycosyltransferase